MPDDILCKSSLLGRLAQHVICKVEAPLAGKAAAEDCQRGGESAEPAAAWKEVLSAGYRLHALRPGAVAWLRSKERLLRQAGTVLVVCHCLFKELCFFCMHCDIHVPGACGPRLLITGPCLRLGAGFGLTPAPKGGASGVPGS